MDLKHNAKKYVWIAVACILLIGMLFYGFKSPPLILETYTIDKSAFKVSFREEGKTRVKERFTVHAPISGQLKRVELEPGDRVALNAPLFEMLAKQPDMLDQRTFAAAEARLEAAKSQVNVAQANLNAVKSSLEYAKKEYRRLSELSEKELVSAEIIDRAYTNFQLKQSEHQSAQFQLKVAEHQVAEAAAHLALFSESTGPQISIRSPINGVVLKRFRESEGLITAGQPVLELGDVNVLELEVDVLSSDAVKLSPGVPVVVNQWGGDQSLKGRVTRVEPSGFTKFSALGVEEQRVWVIAEFAQNVMNQSTGMGDGFRVEVEFILWQGDQVLKAPSSALIKDGDNWFVFKVIDGKASKQNVSVGRQSGLWVSIDEGLNEGDLVVRYPNDNVSEGSSIKVMK